MYLDNKSINKSKKRYYFNYICSETTHKVASRTSGVNKSGKKSIKTKRCISSIKIAGNSRNKSTITGEIKIEQNKSKGGYKYRNLSFYNSQHNDKKKNHVVKGNPLFLIEISSIFSCN